MALAEKRPHIQERSAVDTLDVDRRGRALAGSVLDMLDEAVALTRSVRSQLCLLAEVRPAGSWERLAAISALLRGLDAIGVEAWFSGYRLSGATLHLGSPGLTVVVPEISAAAVALDLRALKSGSPGALRDAVRACDDALLRFTEAREACRSVATRLRWRCG